MTLMPKPKIDLWGNPPTCISSFKDEHEYLSNFHLEPVTWAGVVYKSNEHAYQAAKTLDPQEREIIGGAATPGMAKRFGREATIRPDWDTFKIVVMRKLIRRKFKRGSALAIKLLATGDAELIEGNWWGDRFWGVCNGVGENHLGKLLMERRAQLRKSAKRIRRHR